MTFTHKLSFDEQRLLSPDQQEAYSDWLMARPIKRKLTEEEYLQGDYGRTGSYRNTRWGE